VDTHVKVIAALNFLWGGLYAALAFFMPAVLGVIATIVGHSDDPDAAMAVPILGLTGIGMSIFFGILALPHLLTGWGLWTFRPWARIAGIVLGALSLISFPFGTLAGIYALVILFRKETEALFVKPAPGTAAN
jgi:hypothetical protein